MRSQNAMPTALVADVLGRIAIALAAGVDPRRAWASESARVPPRHRPAMEAASRALAAGGGIADAMRAAEGAFPAFVIGMAQVGDETGHQAETLRELASTLRGTVRSSRALRASLVWPAFQLAMALAVVGLLIFLAGVLTDGNGKAIDILGLGLVGASGLATYVALLGAAAVIGTLALRWTLASWRRHGVARTIAARVPVLGRASAAAEAAAWCRAASLASHAGLSAGRLTALASSAAPGVRIDAAALEDRLRAGATLAEALRETGRFDDRLLHAVAVGEATGNTAEVLDRIAGEFDDESRRGFETAARGVGLAAWAVVSGLIVLVIFRVFSFYVGAIREAVG